MRAIKRNGARLGAMLKNSRKEQKLRLEEISEKLRININFLQCIEDDKLDFLQEPYVLAFIKSYADILGLDTEMIKEKFYQPVMPRPEKKSGYRNYKQSDSSISVIQKREHKSKPGHYVFLKKGKPGKTVSVAVMFAVLILAVVILQKLIDPYNAQDMPGAESLRPDPAFIQEEKGIPGQLQQSSPVVNLKISTDEPLWFSITIDNKEPLEYLLKPGANLSWSAKDEMVIKSGKSTGFEMFFNNKKLENLGSERTMIRRLVLGRDGIRELQLLNRPAEQRSDSTSS